MTEGLEQEFNSLDAQREAAGAFIKSQQHEGWVCLPKEYSDGGFSGGNIERPGVVFKFKVKTQIRGRIRLQLGEKKDVAVGTTSCITKLMALAIKFDALVRIGKVKDYAELARLGHVTRARMSQIMSLLNLAPDTQEAILLLPKTVKGRDPISSREVIRLAAELDWERQREGWFKAVSPVDWALHICGEKL